jgi:hypothetical protein
MQDWEKSEWFKTWLDLAGPTDDGTKGNSDSEDAAE